MKENENFDKGIRRVDLPQWMASRALSPAEQEHADHVAGSASEFQNCYAEAGMVRARLNADQSVAIKAALDEGKFVVVREVPHYCKATDACTGTVRYFEAAFDLRGGAEHYAYEHSGCQDDSTLYVLPRLPAPAPETINDHDDVPF